MKTIPLRMSLLVLGATLSLGSAQAQFPGGPPDQDGPPPFGPGVFGGPGGPGGPGGFNQPEQKLVAQFDKNGDKRLNSDERSAAREFLKKEKAEGRGPRGPRFGGPRGAVSPAKPGAKVSISEVKSFSDKPLYDDTTFRTFFFEFENADWEKELSDFHNTDVEVPARVTVDGKVLAEVGVHFRGASSYNMVGEGQKRSFNLSLDYARKDQRLYGYHTLNLLNSHDDASFLRQVLYSRIARDYVPTPKANLVRVVINGEDWGVYVSAEQFNKDFIKEWFGTTKGARWKVSGSPRGQGSLAYLGEDAKKYQGIYDIKSKDEKKSWDSLIQLCRVLNQTPAEQLESALGPLLDIEGALKFLALENVFINNDGYWIRTSDYSIYQDEKGKFHILPHDINETFSIPGGPGFGRRGRGNGPGGGGGMPQVNGVELDPLVAAKDESKPLLSKLLAVPALRQRYLRHVRQIADKWLDWKNLGPLAEQYHSLIATAVQADTRKLDSFESFEKSLTGTMDSEAPVGFRPGPPRREISLKTFADQRRAYLVRRIDELLR